MGAAKNRIREVVRFIMDPEAGTPVTPSPQPPPSFHVAANPVHPGSFPAPWRFAQPGGDNATPSPCLSEDEAETPLIGNAALLDCKCTSLQSEMAHRLPLHAEIAAPSNS